MPKTAGHIIKGGDVKLGGQFRLDVAQVQSSIGGTQKTTAALVTPKARIMESQPGFAVIEITCSCGKRTNLRCEYAGAQAPEGSKIQNGESAGAEQAPNETKINGEKQNAN